MPVHFDRFRLLNDGSDRRFRNESTKLVRLSPGDGSQPPVVVHPEMAVPLPPSVDNETIIEVETPGE